MKKLFLFILSFYICSLPTSGQTSTNLGYHAEFSATAASNGRAPFYLTANRFGMGGYENFNGYARAGVEGTINLPKHWTIEAGADIAGGWNMTSKVWLQQCYADFSWKMLRISFGLKERLPYPLEKNMMLSTGWMTEGMNTRPIPQIRLDIKEYLPVGFLGNWLALKGHIAYGKFTDNEWKENFAKPGNNFTSDVLYHSKSILFRIGKKEKFPLEFEFGLQLATQFGGKEYLKLEDGEKELIRKMPNDLKAYWSAFFPSHGGSDTSLGEQLNVEGNMLGSWIFGLNYYLNDWAFRIHYDHFFEDHSQMFWEYGRWKDGQIGVEITLPKNRWVSNFIWEGLNTKDQSGSIFYDEYNATISGGQTSGLDNYYNHYRYVGWHHYGMTMGNPLLLGPVYNKNGSLLFRSNRVRSNHFGLSGTPTEEWNWRLLATHTKYWGTYDAPLDKVRKQLYGMIEVSYHPQRIKGWDFSAAIAIDNGNYIDNSFGGMLSIKKSGNFNF